MSLVCPRPQCKEKEGPCNCEIVIVAMLGAVVFFALYYAILNQA